MTAAEPGRCVVHDTEASAICARCGAFVCERCHQPRADQLLCLACQERHANQPPSREALAALVLSLLGPLGIVPALLGGVLGWRELRRIRAGFAPESGEGYARLAQALGALFAVLSAAWALTHFFSAQP